MKKLIYVMVATSTILFACKSKKGTTTDKASGMEIINLPCDEFKTSTETAFRATQSQRSTDLSLSREKALTITKQRLAGIVETKIKSVTDRYVDEYETAQGLEMKGKFNNLTREVVNQQLNDIKIICEKTTQSKDGIYTTFIALEMSKNAVKDAMNNRLSDKAKLAIDYDKMKFEKVFDEEMKKLESGN